jgi:hypothetical protein
MLENDFLPDEDIAERLTLACQALPLEENVDIAFEK